MLHRGLPARAAAERGVARWGAGQPAVESQSDACLEEPQLCQMSRNHPSRWRVGPVPAVNGCRYPPS